LESNTNQIQVDKGMKIALCLSGQVRCFEKCWPTIYAYVIKPLNCDVFFHTWEKGDLKPGLADSFISQDRPIPEYPTLDYNYMQMLLDKIKPKSHLIQKQVEFNIDNITSLWEPGITFRIFSMYYSIAQSMALVSNYEFNNNFVYDCVIRCRFDCLFRKPLNIEDYDLKYIWAPQFHEINIGDQIAISGSANMKIYSLMFNHLSHFLHFCGPEESISNFLRLMGVQFRYLPNDLYFLER